jgi:hypothetical protein
LEICENHKGHKKSVFHPAGNMMINANSMHGGTKSQMTLEQVNGTQIGYDPYEKNMISAMNFFVFGWTSRFAACKESMGRLIHAYSL